jgi:glutathione S-transferase
MGLTPDEAAMPKARLVFAELARLLGGQPFFAGEAISRADLLVAPQLAVFRMTPEWEVLGATRRRREGYSRDTIVNLRAAFGRLSAGIQSMMSCSFRQGQMAMPRVRARIRVKGSIAISG